ncbi:MULTISPECIES: CPBP family intramembrane glutamic endopeptidase [Anaerotruncus]|uniref:CPBP family intramembrane glutamic endopeptidase n=1 Tax=Anaerotruncus TaxID=244127 RepID=UPI000E48E58C|nr:MULTISPECIES: type II CAAX endopeptidase family protein [Anaerotruncus]RGX56963.1 CPBP family intramembrane metalloprotease [Anaerotruncus sp. AF02-27]
MYQNVPQNYGNPNSCPDEAQQRAAAQKAACISAFKMQCGLLALTVILSVLLLYILQTFASWLILDVLWGRNLPVSLDLINELFTTLLYLVAFLFPFLLYAKLVRYHTWEIPRDPPYPPVLAAVTGISLGLSVIGVISSMVLSLFFSIFGLFPMDIAFSFPQDPLAGLLMIVNTTAVPALIEEFTQRGIVLGSLRRYGDRFAIVVSALLFSLLHRNMVQIPNAFLLGLALGYFVVKTNSIWTGIAIHFVNNLLAILITLATQNLYAPIAGILQIALFFFYVVFAAFGLVYLVGIRRADLSVPKSRCPLRDLQLLGKFFTHFPVVMMLLLFAWVIFLNFSRL